MTVYINDIAVFLPNKPVNNDQIENILGIIDKTPSMTKNFILQQNRIETRHYAIDPETHQTTHTNAQLTAEAIRRLKLYKNFSIDDIECIACGTSTPDQLLPGHGLMVHGELEISSREIMTSSGICLSGLTAFKYAYMNIETGFSKNAVSTGSEIASTFIRSDFFTPVNNVQKNPIDNPTLIFDAEFLRWMLSDGAGAVFMSGKKNHDSVSLKVDWIEHKSFAGEFEPCMYAGGIKNENGELIGWRSDKLIDKASKKHILAIKQDVNLLVKNISNTAFNRMLSSVIKKRNIKADDYDWYLPHYSSGYFRGVNFEAFKEINFEIPYEKWFTNLSAKGNTGSASIYIILEELFHSGKLKPGQKLLCFIPESGRFSHAYMQLSVV